MKSPKDILEKLPKLLERYKYALLILILGVFLMLLPGRRQDKAAAEPVDQTRETETGDPGESYRRQVEEALGSLLSQIEGAGRVRVMLTLKTGPANQYQTDRAGSGSSEGDREASSWEEKTVMQSKGSAYNEPAVVTTVYPVFQGALIVAEGGGDPSVRYQLSAAVSALLDLGTDQITVVKMK